VVLATSRIELMNFIRKPMMPRTPTPKIVILMDVVKSSLVGFLISFMSRPMELTKPLRDKSSVSYLRATDITEHGALLSLW